MSPMPRMKVVFGGTFDPVHVGHLRMALELAQTLQQHDPAARVDLLPCFSAVHKDGVGASAADRVAMLRLALANEPLLALDSREIARGTPSFTIDSLRELRAELPQTPLAWVIGSDNLSAVQRWKDFADYSSLCHLIVLGRPGHLMAQAEGLLRVGFERVEQLPALYEAPCGRLLCLNLNALEVSSSYLRDCLETGRSIRYLVPDAVMHYICDNAVYRN